MVSILLLRILLGVFLLPSLSSSLRSLRAADPSTDSHGTDATLRQLQQASSTTSINTASDGSDGTSGSTNRLHHHHVHNNKHLHGNNNSDELTKVPPFLFRTYSDPLTQLHPKLIDLMQHTVQHNPEFIQVYYSDEAIVRFIDKYYPQYSSLYHSLLPGAYRADIWRLLVLYHFGGIYADMGTKFLQPIHSFVTKEDEFVIPIDLDESATWNAFLAFHPRHPILKYIIDWVLDMVRQQRYGCNNLDITGPKAIGRALNRCRRRPDNDVFTPDIKDIQGYKVHFLRFTKELHAFDGNTDVIQNKFEGFYDIVYASKHRLPYGAFYYNRNVYRNDSSTLETRYNGALAHAGRSFWYISNNERRPFPDWDTFLALGMSACTGCELRKGFDNIPIGASLSANNMTLNWQLVHENYPALQCELPTTKRHGFSSAVEVKKYLDFYGTVLQRHRGKVISGEDFEAAEL